MWSLYEMSLKTCTASSIIKALKALYINSKVLVLYDSCKWIRNAFMHFQESLRKIITTLALKNEEIQNFICCLKQSLENLEVNTTAGLLLFLLTSTYWTVWWMSKSFCQLSGGPNMFVQTYFSKPAICNSNTVLSWRRHWKFNSALMVFAGEFKPSAGGYGVRV